MFTALVAKYTEVDNKGNVKSAAQFKADCLRFNSEVAELAESSGKSTAEVAEQVTELAIKRGMLVRDSLGRISSPFDPSLSDIQTRRVNAELADMVILPNDFFAPKKSWGISTL